MYGNCTGKKYVAEAGVSLGTGRVGMARIVKNGEEGGDLTGTGLLLDPGVTSAKFVAGNDTLGG